MPGLGIWSLGFGIGDLLKLIEAFRQLDVRAPGVDDEGNVDAEGVHTAIGHRRLDTLGLELREKLLQVLHLEPDVIDNAPGSGDSRRRRW